MARVDSSSAADQCVSAALTSLILYIVYKLWWKSNGDPKAPPTLPSLPVIGSLQGLYPPRPGLHARLGERARRYGTVFSFCAGSKYIVALNGYDAIHEALVKRSTDFTEHSGMTSGEEVLPQKSIWNFRGSQMQQHGEKHTRSRLLCFALLKQLGHGDQRTTEAKIHCELAHLTTWLRVKNGDAFNPIDILDLTSLNLICNFLFDRRLEPDDFYVRKAAREIANSSDPLCDLFPFLAYLPAHRRKLSAVRSSNAKLVDFVRERICESVQGKQNNNDNFVSEYIRRAGSDHEETELVHTLMDMLVSGAQKLSAQLAWALVLLGNQWDVQGRLQAAVDRVVPRERRPSLGDREGLGYVEATVLEVMRMRAVVPLGALQRTVCDTRVAGYNITAETTIVTNLWSANMDSNFWSEPEAFRPERFLDKDGSVVNHDLMMSFSCGKRACPGKALVLEEMLLLLAGLLQQFHILPPEGSTSIVDEIKANRVLSPEPFELRLVRRDCRP